ncbi:uncharacterized protein LOC121379581 [Gigantopelta aegis]|uniref:uncharacterized protein LOC121379581 n=1 Tax=Gigantopelta aegis TaxID=1735272 RepID=UPI001B88846F|nr:uncharacterized protein LOC121379581 [Gigantopelta aegis]
MVKATVGIFFTLFTPYCEHKVNMMLFSAAFCAMLVLCTAAPSRFKSRSFTDCQVNGKIYRDGEFFTMSANPCLHYRCNKGGYQIEVWECKDSKGACHAINSEIYDRCDVHRCVMQGDWASFVLARKECRDEFGRCHPVGYQRMSHCRLQVCTIADNVAYFKNVNRDGKMC